MPPRCCRDLHRDDHVAGTSTPATEIVVDMCYHQGYVGLPSCKHNCTSYRIARKKCLNDTRLDGYSFELTCQDYPKCGTVTQYSNSTTCKGDARVPSTGVCGRCTTNGNREGQIDPVKISTQVLCNATDISTWQCNSADCTANCTEVVAFPLGKCVVDPFVSKPKKFSYAVASTYTRCTKVDVTTFYAPDCSRKSLQSLQQVGSGECQTTEDHYSLKYTCETNTTRLALLPVADATVLEEIAKASRRRHRQADFSAML